MNRAGTIHLRYRVCLARDGQVCFYPLTSRVSPLLRAAMSSRGRDARERVLSTAYSLFTLHGLNAVGVDRVVAASGVAKSTLVSPPSHQGPSTDRRAQS
jgi:hypothetical protein